MRTILFFLKSNVNCHLPVLIISRILIYINDSYDVLIWSDTQILCMCILNPRTISIIIIKFQFYIEHYLVAKENNEIFYI